MHANVCVTLAWARDRCLGAAFSSLVREGCLQVGGHAASLLRHWLSKLITCLGGGCLGSLGCATLATGATGACVCGCVGGSDLEHFCMLVVLGPARWQLARL